MLYLHLYCLAPPNAFLTRTRNVEGTYANLHQQTKRCQAACLKSVNEKKMKVKPTVSL